MQIEILSDAASVAKEAASVIASAARIAIAERGRFVFAVSGGQTPWMMLRELGKESLRWEKVHVVQVDERIAPAGDPDRNLTHLRESLLAEAAIPQEQIYAMPVELNDPDSAARRYSQSLNTLAGTPVTLDLVHLGLGADGHTASLVPNDPVLNVFDRDVAITGVYQQRKRMTLTYPVINQSRRILWVVTGEAKQEMLKRLCQSDATIPAGRVRSDNATILADCAAAAGLEKQNPCNTEL